MFENNFKIKIFKSLDMDVNCYLIITKYGNIVIDPCVSYDKLSEYGSITTVLITHGHFDHFTSLNTYLNKNVIFMMSSKCLNKLNDSEKNLSKLFLRTLKVNLEGENIITLDGNEVNFKCCNIDLKAVAMPGHSDCSLIYILDNYIFTGDFIFNNSIGRTDFYTSNPSDMKKSISKFLSEMSNDYVLLPGHGSDTTLDYERKYNYYLRK